MVKYTGADSNNIGNIVMRVIEGIIIAAVVGVITMYGTTQAISAKIEYLRSDLCELRGMFVNHINHGKDIPSDSQRIH